MEKATLIIKRTNQYHIRRIKITVLINDKKLGVIGNDETKTFEIPPGSYSLSSKLNWTSSPKLNINILHDQSKEFELGSSANIAKSTNTNNILLSTFVFAVLFIIARYGNSLFIIPLPILFFIWEWYNFKHNQSILYYMTFGRKKYLYLKEFS